MQIDLHKFGQLKYFQRHNWHNYAWFFCFHDDNENEAVEAHIHDIEIPRPKNHDIEIPRPKNHDIEIRGLKHHDIEKWRQISHDIVILRCFFRDKKPRHRDPKTKKPQYWDSKTKKPRHRVPVKFWPSCPLNLCVGEFHTWR